MIMKKYVTLRYPVEKGLKLCHRNWESIGQSTRIETYVHTLAFESCPRERGLKY